jgi:hypothetical protein
VGLTTKRPIRDRKLRLRISLFHVRGELNRRSIAVFTADVRSDISLFAVPASPDSEPVPVEKESAVLTAVFLRKRNRLRVIGTMIMAERVGFEPTVGVNLHTLSKRAP